MTAAARATPGVRGAVIAFVLVALIGGAALVAAGSREPRTTAFTLNVPAARTATTVKPGRRVCQGPIAPPSAFSGVRIWLGAVPAPGAAMRVAAAATPSAHALAVGSLSVPPSSGISVRTVALSARIAKRARVSICLQSTGGVPVPLLGSAPNSHSGMLSSGGKSLGSAATMIFVRPHSTSLLSSLPTVFDRASLFRPNWMHPWVYWVLVAGLLVAAGLLAAGIAAAVRADAEAV